MAAVVFWQSFFYVNTLGVGDGHVMQRLQVKNTFRLSKSNEFVALYIIQVTSCTSPRLIFFLKGGRKSRLKSEYQ